MEGTDGNQAKARAFGNLIEHAARADEGRQSEAQGHEHNPLPEPVNTGELIGQTEFDDGISRHAGRGAFDEGGLGKLHVETSETCSERRPLAQW
jgi:hypothetical protein